MREIQALETIEVEETDVETGTGGAPLDADEEGKEETSEIIETRALENRDPENRDPENRTPETILPSGRPAENLAK